MTIKVHELARELQTSSKELQGKCVGLGISVSSHMSVLSEIDANRLRSISSKSKTASETKIVKAAPRKKDLAEDDDTPRVTVKAAIKIAPVAAKQFSEKSRAEDKTSAQRPPIGRPMISKELEGRPKPPLGKPVVNKELDAREAEKAKAKERLAAEQQAKKEQDAQQSEAPDKAQVALETKLVEENQPVKEALAPKKTEENKSVQETVTPKKDGEFKQPQQTTQVNQEQTRRPQQPSQPRQYQQPTTPRQSQQPTTPRQPQQPAAPRQSQPQQGINRPARKPGSIMDATPRTAAETKPLESRTVPMPAKTTPRPKTQDQYSQRPASKYGSDKPKHSNTEGAPTSGKPATKPGVKKDERGNPKDKDKFTKIDGGPNKKGKKPPYQAVRSLEKTAKPKKHIRQTKEIEPEIDIFELPEGTVIVDVPITVAGFCEQVEIPTSKAIMELMKLGIMATVNQNLDEETVLILGEILGIQVKVGTVFEESVEEGIEIFKDKEEELENRPPVITVMGHVDHGKTSLLDAIRKTHVTDSESGGITQHIGASEAVINGQKIVFLDTPGHEAFTAMRARGAHVTDIAVLVVAADDSVMPQTLESINHAKAAGVHIIVAINKIDKPGADIEKVKKDLADKGILVEAWGGDTIAVPVSAKTGEGITTLLEMILLQAEILELKANPNRLASGTVIEARLDKSKGPIATLLVLNGTLESGQSIVAGTSAGKIRLMNNFKGTAIKKAGPATAVEILGLTEVPEAGDEFNVVKDLSQAKEIATNRRIKVREEVLARNAGSSLEKLFGQLKEGEIKELNMIIKGDVQGSVDAVKTSLEKLKNENVRTNIIHSSVGAITESDVMLAGTVGAILIGFNVRPSTEITLLADREKIEIRSYRVIYNLIEDVESAMKGMLDPVFKEVILGKAEVRETFKVPGVGIIAGSYVVEDKVVRNEKIRLVRDGIIIHEGKISSLKRIKDDAKEVREGFECGIGIENYNDIKEGDIIECFKMEQIERG